MIHSILIIGQSNMAGRGLPSEAKPLNNMKGRLKVLRNGRWQNMYRSVNQNEVSKIQLKKRGHFGCKRTDLSSLFVSRHFVLPSLKLLWRTVPFYLRLRCFAPPDMF